MRHEWTFVVVDGFGSGELDFEARLAAADQAVRDEVDDLIMSPLVNGVDGSVLLVQGHADRVDTGEDHQTCLRLERDASRARASSAAATVLMMIGRDWIDPPPTSWSELPQIGVSESAHGATTMVDESGSETGRLQNRRVILAVCRFFPDE